LQKKKHIKPQVLDPYPADPHRMEKSKCGHEKKKVQEGEKMGGP